MRVLIGATAVLVLAGFAAAQDKKDPKKDEKFDAKKLIGKWEPAEPAKGEKLVAEFADKGKLTLTFEYLGRTEKIDGSYKLDGEKLELALTVAGKEQKETLTLTKLTDDEFVGKGSKGEEKFRKVKAK